MTDDLPTWGANIPHVRTLHLIQALKRYRKHLASKEAVIAKHQPGTSYHTRATREAEGARERITILETELKRRNVTP